MMRCFATSAPSPLSFGTDAGDKGDMREEESHGLKKQLFASHPLFSPCFFSLSFGGCSCRRNDWEACSAGHVSEMTACDDDDLTGHRSHRGAVSAARRASVVNRGSSSPCAARALVYRPHHHQSGATGGWLSSLASSGLPLIERQRYSHSDAETAAWRPRCRSRVRRRSVAMMVGMALMQACRYNWFGRTTGSGLPWALTTQVCEPGPVGKGSIARSRSVRRHVGPGLQGGFCAERQIR